MKNSIIYYTSNAENFEDKIRSEFKANIPIISVSQKPIDFGENICVGDVGQTYLNAFRQLLIGAKKATSDFVFTVEADCLYPEGYFDFEPTDVNKIYSYDNAWILYKGRYFKKDQTHGTLVYGRKYLIKFLEKCLKGLPKWSREKIPFPFYTDHTFEPFTGEPVVNIRTGQGVNKKSMHEHRPVEELPYWGKAEDLVRKYEIPT
jgi:hypothetical protein